MAKLEGIGDLNATRTRSPLRPRPPWYAVLVMFRSFRRTSSVLFPALLVSLQFAESHQAQRHLLP